MDPGWGDFNIDMHTDRGEKLAEVMEEAGLVDMIWDVGAQSYTLIPGRIPGKIPHSSTSCSWWIVQRCRSSFCSHSGVPTTALVVSSILVGGAVRQGLLEDESDLPTYSLLC